MYIIIAPNAFKNSLPAEQAAHAIREGLLESGLRCSLQCFPIGDGGDGTASLIVGHGKGFFYETEAHDPLCRKIKTTMGFLDKGKTAVIEMADISGLKLLKPEELDPLHSSSLGTGELIRTAMDKGSQRILLCLGGSATIDGGCGILQALGTRFLNKERETLTGLPENLIYLESIDISGIDQRIYSTEFIILCDVRNFLLGETGAAAIFGPQKGASPEEIILIEKGLARLRKIALIQTGKDMNTFRHGGAAGGAAAGLKVFLNAKLVSGIEYFLALNDFDGALQKADMLITGEGSIDLQTLEGKGPFEVAKRAKKKNIPVIGMAGKIPVEPNALIDEYFDLLLSVNHAGEDLSTAMQNTAINLRNAAIELGNFIMKKFT
jgi:glycerate 2-kinase